MKEEFLELDIDTIEFDLDNPRIKEALGKYKSRPNAERIFFALRTATADQSAGSRAGFEHLRASIKAYKGIAQPIVVAERDGKKVCIDGNTRLAIFKDFHEHNEAGDWSKIRVTLIRDAKQIDIEKIRTSAHMVGARQWPPYEKARYLNYLRNEEFMGYDEMIALCGGNKADIERQIYAFDDMNDYYRDAIEDDNEFRLDRFSGFVELQKPGIKDAIYSADLSIKDFGQWIHKGQIHRLADVRHLPEVLRDEEAKEIFLQGGVNSIKEAIKHVERKSRPMPPDDVLIQRASIPLLAQTLKQKINDMPASEYRGWQRGESEADVQTVQILQDLYETLEDTLRDVGKS